jgi:hypothetical protein
MSQQPNTEPIDDVVLMPALVRLQMHQYMELRRFFREIGLDPAPLDEIADSVGDMPSAPPVAGGQPESNGFRSDPPWSQDS